MNYLYSLKNKAHICNTCIKKSTMSGLPKDLPTIHVACHIHTPFPILDNVKKTKGIFQISTNSNGRIHCSICPYHPSDPYSGTHRLFFVFLFYCPKFFVKTHPTPCLETPQKHTHTLIDLFAISKIPCNFKNIECPEGVSIILEIVNPGKHRDRTDIVFRNQEREIHCSVFGFWFLNAIVLLLIARLWFFPT